METTVVPVNLKPEASERIAEVGIQREFEEIVDHLQQTVQDLRCIEVEVQDDPNHAIPPVIVISPRKGHFDGNDDPTNRQIDEWLVRRFSPNVFQHLVVMCLYEEDNGR